MDLTAINSSLFKKDPASVSKKRDFFDPNRLAHQVASSILEEENWESCYCEACGGFESVVHSFTLELENGVELSGEDLGENIVYPDSAESFLLNIMEHLEQYVESIDQLAPVTEISWGTFCACCLGCLD